MDRRTLLMAAGTAALAAGTAARATDDAEVVDYLFVQTAAGATLSDGVLRLSGIGRRTLYFSDRPERIVGHVTTADFVEHWGTGDDSFLSDPPNAVLTIKSWDAEDEVTLVLKDPRTEGEDLVYDVEVLSGPTETEGELASLFIDLIGRPLTPLSFAGVARRTRRRAWRYGRW